MPTKRYYAYLKIDKFPYRGGNYRNVKMKLFKTDLTEIERAGLPLIIRDYENMDETEKIYAQSVTEELFTGKEISQMKPYFERFRGARLELHEVKLPMNAKNILGVAALPVGGLQDCHMFSKRKGYPLNFRVWGYYDLRRNLAELGMGSFRKKA